MKQKFKILVVLVLSVIYSFGVWSVTTYMVHRDIQHHSSSSQEKIFSDITSKLFSHSTHSQNIVNYYNNQTAPIFKSVFKGFGGTLFKSEEIFEHEFTQYTINWRNFLIHYRKSDIIFPFHYFW